LEFLREYSEPRELSLLDAAGEVKNVARIKGKAARGLAEFAAIMRDLRALSEGRPDEVIRAALDRSGYRQMLTDSRDEEEEGRLAFVGITRAKEECYLTHARLREFRGTALYAIPSFFLEELPKDATEEIDVSTSAAGRQQVMDEWRGGGKAAESGWEEAG